MIDVGYSGVIGADRIVHGQSPYGHFPVEDTRPKCGPADSSGEVRDRIQTNGRCETREPARRHLRAGLVPRLHPRLLRSSAGATSGTRCPSVHFTSILFDTLCLLGLALVGRRFGGPRLAADARVRVGRVAVHAVRVELEHERRDHAGVADLGLPRADEPGRRAASAVALSGWTKFASLLLCRCGPAIPRRGGRGAMPSFALGVRASTTVLVFFVLFLEPSPLHAARVFYDRTVSFQVGRESPFSLWDWRQYHAKGTPGPAPRPARARGAARRCGALALGWFPRRRSPLRFAALTAAVLVGFELVLTHWFYLYLPWFFPFVALALIAPLPGAERAGAGAGRAMSGPTRARWPPSDDRRRRGARRVGGLPRRLGARPPVVLGARRSSSTGRRTRRYGDAIKAGRVPYRDFAVEYPPGSLPVFALPSLLGGDYATTFAWLMAACGVALVWVVAARCGRAAALYVALAPVLSGSLILSRFDLWPALLATGALVALLAGRHRLGWALLGAAVAAKLWPLVLVPLGARLVGAPRRARAAALTAPRCSRSPSCRSRRRAARRRGRASPARRRGRCRSRASAPRC